MNDVETVRRAISHRMESGWGGHDAAEALGRIEAVVEAARTYRRVFIDGFPGIDLDQPLKRLFLAVEEVC